MEIHEKDLLAEVSVRKYSTARAILDKFWSFGNDDIGTDEVEMGGVTTDGEHVTLSMDQQLESIQQDGFWGYYDKHENVIHAWISDNVAPNDLLFFLGHELGHVWNDNPVTIDPEGLTESEKTAFLDEVYADRFGAVAMHAVRLRNQLTADEA